ncbi:MAG: hypothetical protein V4635_02320 [Bacteroidota bacterium]
MAANKITPLYFADGYLKSWFDHEKKVLVIKFFSLNLGIHRQKAFDINVNTVEKYKGNTAILDASEATGHHQPSDTDWIMNTALPGYKAKGIRLIIYVFPDNMIARIGARTWLEMAGKFGFDFLQANTIDEGYELLKSHTFR